MEDKNFAERLNILRAGVLGANDGIISIAGVVIGVASATSNIWFILISALSAIFAGAFSMAGGEYVSVAQRRRAARRCNAHSHSTGAPGRPRLRPTTIFRILI